MSGGRWGALTPVALRAPSVSAPQNRNFLLCLDSHSYCKWEMSCQVLHLLLVSELDFQCSPIRLLPR